MTGLLRCIVIGCAALGLLSCDDTDFASTWQDSSVRSINFRNSTVAAFLLTNNEALRRGFEYNIAREMNKHGIDGVPGYKLVPDSITDEKEALQVLQRSRPNVDEAVFMRIVGREQQATYFPGVYGGPFYDPFWGPGPRAGFWGYGYAPGYVRIDTVVSVETLVYSLPEKKLIWAGVSRTMNPSEVDDFAEDLVEATAKEMRKKGFIRGES